MFLQEQLAAKWDTSLAADRDYEALSNHSPSSRRWQRQITLISCRSELILVLSTRLSWRIHDLYGQDGGGTDGCRPATERPGELVYGPRV